MLYAIRQVALFKRVVKGIAMSLNVKLQFKGASELFKKEQLELKGTINPKSPSNFRFSFEYEIF